MRGKILLVDDNTELCVQFKLWYQEYEITGASTAESALVILKKPNEFDLVILDVNLPGMSGLSALEKVKELAPEKRVIIMTGYSTKDTAIHALTGKADNYVEKPFELKTMRAAIEKEMSAVRHEALPDDMDMTAKIKHVRGFIEGNCFKKITLRDAAAAVFLTPKYLSRVFRIKTGMGFGEYKLKVKVAQAKRMLREPGVSVKKIAARLGYANTESFTRQFRKIVKSNPSCFRGGSRCVRRKKKSA